MANLPASKYVEIRDDGKVCLAGTRIGLDILILMAKTNSRRKDEIL